MLTPFQESLRVVFLLLGGMLVVNAMVHGYVAKTRLYRTTLAVLVVLAIASSVVYLRFGRLHKSDAFPYRYHYLDVYHYTLGSKYFKELGYFHDYDAVYVALWEIEEAKVIDTPVETIHKVRDLEHPERTRDLARLRTVDGEAVKARFTPARWAAFRGDVQAFLSFKGWSPWMWQRMVDDQGFNPPPSWVVVPWVLTNAIPLNASTVELYSLIDFLLVFVLGAWLVYRGFGAYPLAAYFIVFGNNVLTDFEWIGWDFIRHAWFVSVLAGVVCLKLERKRWAGFCMGLAVCLRVFPAVFLLGALLALAYEAYHDPTKRRGLRDFVVAAAVTGVVLVAASLLLFDPHYWVEFATKIRHHADHVWANHLGFKRLVIHAYDLRKITLPPGLADFERAKFSFKVAYGKLAIIWEPLRYALTALACFLALRMAPWRAALAVGVSALFLLTEPANYYYLHLTLLPVVFFTHEARDTDVARVAAAFAMLVGCWLAEQVTSNVDHQMIYASWSVAGFLAVLLGSLMVDQYPALAGWWRARRSAAKDQPA